MRTGKKREDLQKKRWGWKSERGRGWEAVTLVGVLFYIYIQGLSSDHRSLWRYAVTGEWAMSIQKITYQMVAFTGPCSDRAVVS
jgi:hypothetical protein